MPKEYPWGKGTVRWTRDAALNDSDKTFTVPAGKVWDLKSIEAHIVTTATVGNRVLTYNISNAAGDMVVSGVPSGNIAASANGGYVAGVGVFDSTTVHNRLTAANQTNSVQRNTGMTDVLLTAGMIIRVWDMAAIDAAADDLTVVLHYVEYDA